MVMAVFTFRGTSARDRWMDEARGGRGRVNQVIVPDWQWPHRNVIDRGIYTLREGQGEGIPCL